MYYAMYVIGFIVMMIISVTNAKKHHVTVPRAVCYTLITYVFGVASAILMGNIYSGYAASKGCFDESRVAIFGAVIFLPLLLLITEGIEYAIRKYLLKQNRFTGVLDLLTPGIFSILASAKLGCGITGCCCGIPWEHGVFNEQLGMELFPVQFCEFITMAVVVAISLSLRRMRFYRRGCVYPITAGLYSVTRFCWEFLRYYPSEEVRNALFGLTFWQVCCVFVFIMSAIAAAVIFKKGAHEKCR